MIEIINVINQLAKHLFMRLALVVSVGKGIASSHATAPSQWIKPCRNDI
jgi:hypothetical protein